MIAHERGLRVVADAKPDEAESVRSHGADIVVDRKPGFAQAVQREFPGGVDALLDARSAAGGDMPSQRPASTMSEAKAD